MMEQKCMWLMQQRLTLLIFSNILVIDTFRGPGIILKMYEGYGNIQLETSL